MKLLKGITCYLVLCCTAMLSSCKNESQTVPTVFEYEVRFTLPGDTQINHVTVGDMDADGKADLVASAQGNLLIYRNTSTPGKFNRTFEGPLKFENSGNLTWLELIDVDKDGKLDVAQSRNAPGDASG
jgi:hypothetical protein